MLTPTQSKLAFVFGCIPARLLLAYLPQILDKKLLLFYGIVLLVISMSFYYLYFFNKRQIAFEAGGKTWWTNLRIFHGNHYLLAGLLAINGNTNASIPLLIDAIFGLFSFIYHRFYCN